MNGAPMSITGYAWWLTITILTLGAISGLSIYGPIWWQRALASHRRRMERVHRLGHPFPQHGSLDNQPARLIAAVVADMAARRQR